MHDTKANAATAANATELKIFFFIVLIYNLLFTIEKFETLVSLSCLTSLTILVDDAMDALLAQTRVVVDMLRGELAVLLENQLYGK